MNRSAMDAEAQQLDELMQIFYEVISFDDGSAPNWSQMASLFSSHARITRLTPEGIDYMDLASFRGMAEELIEVGAFTSFHEREIARRAERYGDVIHVASAYETKISPAAQDYLERGVNSLQWIREHDSWKIISLCWDVQAGVNVEGMRLIEHGSVAHGQG
jgi:hypothetical protein